MIAKLRIKFIAISTVAVLLVIAVLLGLVNSVMYHRTLDDVYKIANYIAENDGEMPESQMKKSPDFTDEDIYRIRFFTVKADSDGNVISSDLGRIHSVSDSDIKTFITSVQKDNGHIETDGDAFAYVSVLEMPCDYADKGSTPSDAAATALSVKYCRPTFCALLQLASMAATSSWSEQKAKPTVG